jgi:predicted outer membrane protein
MTRCRAARLLAAVGLGLLAAVLPAALPAHAQDGTVETQWGPLTESDRDLIIRVRYAGLWEIPAGEMAVERGTDERVREIGAFIRDEHIELDIATAEVANQLGVELPDEPFSQHVTFLNRMDQAEGEQFDLEFVQALREQHGDIYSLIAYVRAGTQNALVRDFAETGEEFVSRHMTYLESTGLVDWFHIKPPPDPAGAPSRFLAVEPAGVNPYFVWAILGAAGIAGAITLIRTLRPR